MTENEAVCLIGQYVIERTRSGDIKSKLIGTCPQGIQVERSWWVRACSSHMLSKREVVPYENVLMAWG